MYLLMSPPDVHFHCHNLFLAKTFHDTKLNCLQSERDFFIFSVSPEGSLNVFGSAGVLLSLSSF